MTNNATELLRRALEALDRDCADSWNLDTEIRAFLEVEPEAEPVDQECYAFAPSKVVARYPFPPRPEPARNPLPEKIDPILRTVGSTSCSPSYVAGWNNCIDAMSNGAEARKPMTEVEMMTGYGKLKPHGLVDFALGVRFAEKHHGISEE